jgi:hypothetical protein
MDQTVEQHPLTGAKLFIYRARPQPIMLLPLFADEAQTVPIDNPLIADANGKFPRAHYPKPQQGQLYEVRGETAAGETMNLLARSSLR